MGQAFRHADFNVVRDLHLHDTIIMCSDGVTDNIGDAYLGTLVAKAYSQNSSPEDLAQSIVAESLAAAYVMGGGASQTTRPVL